MTACAERLAVDRRFVGWTVASSTVALVAFGLVAAIIPNPVFGRQIPPEPFATAVWILSAPLMGLVGLRSPLTFKRLEAVRWRQ